MSCWPPNVRSICFENLDVIAARAAGEARGVPTDLDSLTAKLLDAGRGGYCHEHATLIRAVLHELGLSAHPILARVHIGGGRTAPGGLTHQATVVDLAGRRFLVDPGFGGGTPQVALELDAESQPRSTEYGEYRLVTADTVLEPEMRAEAEWALQSRTSADQEFRTVYAFADIPREHVDLEVSNWFTATNRARASPAHRWWPGRSATAERCRSKAVTCAASVPVGSPKALSGQ